MNYLKRFWAEAKGKMTVWVGLLIASSSEVKDSWGDITSNLPQWTWLVWTEKHLFAVLGLVVVYARVRRAMK